VSADCARKNPIENSPTIGKKKYGTFWKINNTQNI
jgi:hypothetical protein